MDSYPARRGHRPGVPEVQTLRDDS
ncbi:hypothetical protein GBAR_LOCUS25965 [Geodia barretti]|uniref:Uncharacterized protein n=1 Tax=Geodia barretti TaxID=519541 RepID=A0AA35TEQ3_GEOBA|nr:hypothetical protein GBAR_LOCUS25965 [Geodia barretti]